MTQDPPNEDVDLSKPAPDDGLLDEAAPKRAGEPPDLAEAFADAPPDPEDLAALSSWEPEATPGSLVALLPNKWVRRAALTAIPVLALFFGSGLILASQLSLNHALQVFGTTSSPAADSSAKVQSGRVQAVFHAGHRNALRVAIWNRRSKKHEHQFQGRLTLRGGPGKVKRTLFNGVSGPGTALETNFDLPGLAPGRYTLEVTARLDDQDFRTRIPARLVRRLKDRAPVPIEKPKSGVDLLTRSVDADRVTVEFLPAAGKRVTTELMERITVRTTDEKGRPVRAKFRIWLAKGRLLDALPGSPVGKAFTTDALGLHTFRIVSRHPALAFRVWYQALGVTPEGRDGAERNGVFTFSRRNAQAVLLPDRVVVPTGSTLGVNVMTLSDSGYLYLDQFSGGLRNGTRSIHVAKHRARTSFVAPRQPGLYRLQATDDFSNPGTGITARTLWASAPGETARQALPKIAKAVLAQLPNADKRSRTHIQQLLDTGAFAQQGYDAHRAAAYLLSRLDHLHHPTAWLADTTRADTKALAARKASLQRILMVGLAFTALLLLGVVVPLVYTNLQLSRTGTEERDALMAEFEATATEAERSASAADRHADGGEVITDLREVREEQQRVDRLRHRVQIGLIVFIILGTITAIVGLLLRLSWGWR